jgi:hypothetical protein
MRAAPESRTVAYLACLTLAVTADHLVVLADDRGLQSAESWLSARGLASAGGASH